MLLEEETSLENLTLTNQSLDFLYETRFPIMCSFQKVKTIGDFYELFHHKECYRYSFGFTVFLCLANLLILLFGFLGNVLVIYVVVVKQKLKTASSVFILNLAVADLFVIVCCIPATLLANLIIPWVLGEPLCKITTYSQGVSVFSSVYSLVAISFDRFRAIHKSLGVTPNISITTSYKIVWIIWILGLLITLPWAFVFKVSHHNPYKEEYPDFELFGQPMLPFCREVWETKSQETVYFILVHFFVCFILPFGIITACNVVLWRDMLGSAACAPSNSNCSVANLNRSGIQEGQRRRKLRVLKMFTGLTFAFFFCWLPLYLLQGRVKLYYTETYKGSAFEQWLVSVLIPAAQLLGSCNSCINPVLYALLNRKFRQSFKQIFECKICSFLKSHTLSPRSPDEHISLAVIAPVNLAQENGH